MAVASWVVTGNNDGVGLIAMILNVLMLFGPLASMGEVIRTRSTASFPFPPLLWTLIASTLWCVYGVYIGEVPVYLPNALGILFGFVQISLFVWARSHQGKTTDDIIT